MIRSIETTRNILKALNMFHTAEVLNELFKKAREESLTCEKFLDEALREEIKGLEKR